MNKEQQQIIDEAYEDYSKAYEKDNSIGLTALVKMVQRGRSLHRKPSRDMFVAMCTHDKTFSEKWGLKIEEKVLSLSERGELFRKTYPENSVDDFASGGMEVQSISHQLNTRYKNANIPTKLMTVTYKDRTIEVYE